MKFREFKWKFFLIRKKLLRPFKNGFAYFFISRTKACKFLFILGHMRSRSTLLSHILNSHDEIHGIGESNRVYKTPLNFAKQVLASVFQNYRFRAFDSLILDQVNHNHMTPDLELLASYDIKFLFLVRKPKDALESMLSVFGENKNKPFQLTDAMSYYKQRLLFLKRVKEGLSGECFFIVDSDELINDSEKTLSEITSFLALSKPLQANYKLQRYTGKRGDATEQIFTGEISKESTKKKSQINEDLSELEELFRQILS